MINEIPPDEEERKDTEPQDRDTHNNDWLPTMENRRETTDEAEGSDLFIKFITSQDDLKTAL